MIDKTDKIVTLIIGAGDAGQLLAEDIMIQKDSGVQIVGYIDDDDSKQATNYGNLPVLGRIKDIRDVVSTYNVEELLIAIPSQRGTLVRQIVLDTAGLGLAYKILPRASEVLHQDHEEDYVKYIRRVDVEDLLGGEITKSDQKEVDNFTDGKTILVTGAAGSIGSELSRQLVTYGVKKAILYDWWENGIFELSNQIKELNSDVEVEFVIGDINDHNKLSRLLDTHRPHTIFHAAAYKHVPLMEENPAEAVKNNIQGTRNVAQLAIQYKVKKFILVSTDKAVNPTNIMGATKRAAEKIINTLSMSQTETIFCAVRFGNVINSNGSAIPVFKKQIERGGPVTVTHEDITRFFMTITEAVHLILRSWILGENNDLFVLDMGESVKIYDLAQALIILEGYTPGKEIPINVVGLRPGEKLYEEVLIQEEGVSATPINKVFRTKNSRSFDPLVFLSQLSILTSVVESDNLDKKAISEQLQRMISTYKPASH
jgi:FlaA1/EpsC-like NDP-sugar epimerase